MKSSGIRLTSAFLFAICALVLAYGTAWYFLMQRAEQNVKNLLGDSLGAVVSTSNIRWNYAPLQVHLTLENVKATFTDQENKKLIFNIGNVELFTDFLSDYKLVVKLPSKQKLVVFKNNIELTNIFIEMQDGELSFYNLDTGKESIFSASSLNIKRKNKSTILTSNDTYILAKTPYKNITKELRISITDLITSGILASYIPNLKVFLVDITLNKNLNINMNNIAPALVAGHKNEINSTLLTVIENIAENKSKIKLNDSRIEVNNFWIAVRGNIQVDSKYRLNGDFSATNNGVSKLLNYLDKKELIHNPEIVQRSNFIKLFTEKEQESTVNININQGVITIDGAIAGKMPPVAKLLP